MNETRPTSVLVFAASSASVGEVYSSAARRLGELIARRGWTTVNGAGASGLMRAVSDGALDAGGHVTGVIPLFMVNNGWNYDRLPELIITADMHERKQHMSSITDAVIALPGSVGTLEELFEALTWRQLGIIDKPIVLLNTAGFFTPLTDMLRHCIDEGFLKPSHAALWTVADTPEQAVDAVAGQLGHPSTPIEPKY